MKCINLLNVWTFDVEKIYNTDHKAVYSQRKTLWHLQSCIWKMQLSWQTRQNMLQHCEQSLPKWVNTNVIHWRKQNSVYIMQWCHKIMVSWQCDKLTLCHAWNQTTSLSIDSRKSILILELSSECLIMPSYFSVKILYL